MQQQFQGEHIYLAELDVHFPELTLGETLSFAASTRTVGSNYKSVSRNSGRDVASMFHLDTALDTRVGNAMIRGLSGGEKRRLSLAKAFISSAQLQCWDNSTRGLDSSAALRLINLRTSADTLKSTVLMSVYQASEDMYQVSALLPRITSFEADEFGIQNFDKVTVLYEGRQIYYGPANCAVDYFIGLGFARPARPTTADFLTSMTNPERAHRPRRLPRSSPAVTGRVCWSMETKPGGEDTSQHHRQI